jgi:hypothetical protein
MLRYSVDILPCYKNGNLWYNSGNPMATYVRLSLTDRGDAKLYLSSNFRSGCDSGERSGAEH